MSNREILDKIKGMSIKEQRAIKYEDLVQIVRRLNTEEVIELTNIIGYPVFTRKLMGDLEHTFVLLQDGAAVVIVNENGEILLQSRADRDAWGLPGGCQDLGENLRRTGQREVKEETNLDIALEDLNLIEIVSGESRRNSYPNGDVVFNNTALYWADTYSGELKWDEESKDLRFFSLNNLPENQHDPDLIEMYVEKVHNKRR